MLAGALSRALTNWYTTTMEASTWTRQVCEHVRVCVCLIVCVCDGIQLRWRYLHGHGRCVNMCVFVCVFDWVCALMCESCACECLTII